MFKIKSISNLISCVSSRAIIYAQALRHAPGWGWVTPISIQSVNFCLPAGKGGCFFFLSLVAFTSHIAQEMLFVQLPIFSILFVVVLAQLCN